MGKNQPSITLSVTQQEKEQLEAIALEMGCTWGDRPNVSGLVKAIAAKELFVSKKPAAGDEAIRAIAAIKKIIKGM